MLDNSDWESSIQQIYLAKISGLWSRLLDTWLKQWRNLWYVGHNAILGHISPRKYQYWHCFGIGIIFRIRVCIRYTVLRRVESDGTWWSKNDIIGLDELGHRSDIARIDVGLAGYRYFQLFYTGYWYVVACIYEVCLSSIKLGEESGSRVCNINKVWLTPGWRCFCIPQIISHTGWYGSQITPFLTWSLTLGDMTVSSHHF